MKHVLEIIFNFNMSSSYIFFKLHAYETFFHKPISKLPRYLILNRDIWICSAQNVEMPGYTGKSKDNKSGYACF